MSKRKTKIEWCDYTINCFWGCDGGCTYCSARKLAKRFGRHIGEARNYPSGVVKRMEEFRPVFLPDQLEVITEIKEPSKFFISEMGDWCGKSVPSEWTKEALDTIRNNPQHIFITSTKQPHNLPKFNFPKNCWVGIGATDREMALKALATFKETQAEVKYLMCEPLLSPMGELDLTGISLVIIGSQTNPYRPPEAAWVDEIARAADEVGTAVFVKNNLYPVVEPLIMKYQSRGLGLPIWSDKPFAKLRQELWSSGYFSR